MKIVTPLAITDAIFTSSTIAEDDHLEWDFLTTYARGDYCISSTTHTVYRSLADANLDNDPDLEQVALADPLIDDPTVQQWQVIGATNKWRLFDGKPSVQTVGGESFTVTLTTGVFIQAIAFFNLTASSLSITMTDPVEGVVFSVDQPLYDETIADWYEYYFSTTSVAALDEWLVLDIPPFGSATIEITITNTGGAAAAGQIVLGKVTETGFVTSRNSGLSSLDFSYVDQDTFGNLSTVVRPSIRLSDFYAVVNTLDLSTIDRLFRNFRGGKPAVWIGDDDVRKAALNYGFYKSYRVDYEDGEKSTIAIQIQGIA